MLATIPSPSQGVYHLGPVPLRMYALCIVLGVLAAVWIGNRRYVARGGEPGFVADMATVAVPAGLVGARLYHVVTSPSAYFGDTGRPVEALYIWRGGLGIWGGVLGGCIAAWAMCKRRGLSFAVLADACIPGVAVAQAIGRFGNYFNQELYGRATDLPWGLEIDAAHAPGGIAGTFHPTFLYESLWDLGVAYLLVRVDRAWRPAAGRLIAVYVAAYCLGRAWIESLRIDTAQTYFGLRLNDYVAGVLLLLAVGYLVATRGQRRTADELPAADEAAGTDEAPGTSEDDDPLAEH